MLPADKEPVIDGFMLDENDQWVPVRNPIHFDKPHVTGVGPGYEFLRLYLKRHPGVKVGLIPCAFGGTSINQWRVGGKLYTTAVRRAKAAMANGKLKGILWHQGEADAKPERLDTYPALFQTMISQLRQDLDTPDMPLVIGELGQFNEQYIEFNKLFPEIVKLVPNSICVSADGLESKRDKIHFSRAAQLILGERYFTAWTELTGVAD